ncbi:protein abrupt-like isoform X2 [Pseudomyrmex gracilis]|uniref:protein abrupt-like isoform X2 n=1 Tax=Pseudomyrmex gracilis TaxID=219809 RepID=UPI0009959C0F|nr:protein abrupt-like isoform X2 [Pseudomyrmex gracilis]
MKEDSLLSFKWQSFPSHMVGSLDNCYEKQQFVDLSLVCKDNTIIKCHKMVLANSSSFFRRLLVANDHPHPMIILHDIEADDLKTLVNFMYCGEIQVVQSEVKRLLKLAEILEVTGLRHVPTNVMNTEGFNDVMSKEQMDVTPKKTATVSRLKLEETRSSSSSRNTVPEHEDTTKKKEDININELSQRLETSNSGIILDINDIPSTSKGLPNISLKRKESSDPAISWQHVLSTMSNDKSVSFKKLRCIMDEIEITPGKLPTDMPENKQNALLDRRKIKKNLSEDHNPNIVLIKDEINISSEEEDIDMDPLEVDEDIENVTAESNPKNSSVLNYVRR